MSPPKTNIEENLTFIVVDLEATCWRGKSPVQNETIEIGAVAFQRQEGVISEFAEFIRPKLAPNLSDFCIELTSIRQEQIDHAAPFPDVFDRFCRWMAQHEPWLFCSWGAYDRKQLLRDCALHDLEWELPRHLNLKSAMAAIYQGPRLGMAAALGKLGIPLNGTHHRGIDDARNITAMLQRMTADKPDFAGWNPFDPFNTPKRS